MRMKIILRSEVEGLGHAGDIKEVSGGFGRNFLIPKGLAEIATPQAITWWQKGAEKRAKLAVKRLSTDQDLAKKLEGVSLSFARQASPEGKLFGSVGKTDLIKSLKSAGYTVGKSAIVLESAMKQTGEFEVDVVLQKDATAKVKVSIVARQ